MQATLMESGRPRKRTPGGTAASILFHTALLTGLATGTGISSPRPAAPERVDTLVYTPQPVHPTAQREIRHGHARGLSGEIAQTPIALPQFSFPSTTDPVVIDGPRQSSVEPVFLGQSIAGGTSVDHRAVSLSDALDSREVDTPVQPLPGNVPPRYPSLLATAGLEGRVVARFVVDTLGYVEPISIRISQTTHPLFERAVRDALKQHRFTAATVGGRKVRQLVEQTFGFQLAR